MVSVILYSVCAIIAITSAVSGEEGGTCRACNCQFNNAEVLNRLIESKIASGKLAIVPSSHHIVIFSHSYNYHNRKQHQEIILSRVHC